MKFLSLLLMSACLSSHALPVSAGPSGNANRIQGRPISSTAPSDTQVIAWNASTAKWEPTDAAAGGGSGVTTVGTFGSSPDAKGASISGTTITMQPADGTHPGLVTTGTQTMAGQKTFSTGVTATVTGNASTATALAANPTDCGSNVYATAIDASGNLTCASITNASTTAVSTNTNSTIVLRDGSGNFTAGTVTATLTGRVNSTQVVETVVAGGTCSTTYTVDPTTGTMFNVTLSGACAFAVTNLAAGHSFTIKLSQTSTTAPTFAAAYKWASATAPTWSVVNGKFDMIACVSLDGTTLDCSGVIDVR